MNESENGSGAPKWINQVFMEEILKNSDSDQSAKLTSYELSNPMGLKAHFGSIMFQSTLKYSTSSTPTKNLSIIIKAMPESNGTQGNFLSELNIFKAEISIYRNIIPKCQDLIRSIDYGTPISPRMFYASESPHQLLILEDLTEKGFSPVHDRLPNAIEATLILEKLALYHATSYKMFHEGDTRLTSYKGSMFNYPTLTQGPAFLTGIKFLTEAVEQMPGFEKYAEDLKKITPKELLGRCVETCTNLGSYNVLNHGDCHIKNMMFKRDSDGNAIDVMFLDYQGPVWGTPAFDLMYVCTDIDEAVDGLYDPIEFYFKKFTEILKKSKFSGPLPTFLQLKMEVKWNSHIELYMFASFGCFFSLFEEDCKFDMADVFTSSEARQTLYETKFYKDRIKRMLPILKRKGCFERFK